MKGIAKRNHEELFPASPTLIEHINIANAIKKKWLEKRKAHLLAKEQSTYIYDNRLRPYQNNDVNFLKQLNKGKGVFNQQRVGKTPTTLVTMRIKNQHRNIIIVPKSTIHQWKKEYDKWHGGRQVIIKDSWSKEKRIKAYKEQEGTLITNYEKIRIDLEEIIEHLAPLDAIILDEAHYVRNYKGTGANASTPMTVKSIMHLRKHATDAYALTGTPTPNKEADICGILAFLYPDLFRFYWPTVNYYFNIETNTNYNVGKEYNTVQNFKDAYKEKEMLEFLETFSIQRKRSEVMQWLPEVDVETVKLEPTSKQIKWYKELEKYFETEHVVCENVLTTMIAMRQIAHDPSVLNLKSRNPKFEWLKDHIEDYPDKPIVIVSSFSSILKNLKEYLKKYNPRLMFGETSSQRRNEMINDFQNNKFNILLANIQVAKEGITLSRAEEIIFLDPSLTYTDNEQMKDRFLPTTPEEAINKEGQKIIHLLLKKSIDMYIARSLEKKQKATDIINNYLKYLKGEKI